MVVRLMCDARPILSRPLRELLFEVFSQRYERGATLVTSNLPFNEWTSVFGFERLTGALLDRLQAERTSFCSASTSSGSAARSTFIREESN
jgi:DNA replication protein DnaC